MFALGLNLFFALIYVWQAIQRGAETPTHVGWFGGLHIGLAIALAMYLWVNRREA